MVNYIDKKATYIEDFVEIGDKTTIYPNVMIEGKTKIGNNCMIHMGCYIKDTIIGDNTIIYSSHIENSQIGNNCNIGPYAHIRNGNIIQNLVKVGSFVELKNNSIQEQTKIPHLSYIGDSQVGKEVNIGCGVITANYDGKEKHQTIIQDKAFIGCNSNLIAPITIGKKSIVAAGSTITKDVPDGSLIRGQSKYVVKKYEEEC